VWPETPHTPNGEMPHSLALWVLSFAVHKGLNRNADIKENLERFTIQHNIIFGATIAP
jgi:hypothetical protein